MANDDLQSIVDGLAERLQRSVAIDDPSIRLLAASRHFGDEDAVRVASVLNRSVSADLVERVLAHGVARWTGPGSVVVGAEGCLPRLCAPIRCNGLLLGYLWLIDTGPAPEPASVELAAEAAERAGVVLYRRLLLHERTKARHEAILRELVSADPATRTQAAADLRDEQLFPERTGHYQVVAVCCRGGDGIPAASRQAALEAGVEDGLRAVPGDRHLMVAHRTRAWILLADEQVLPRSRLDALTSRVAARFGDLTGGGAARVVIGTGAAVTSLERVVESYRQAFLATRAALLVPGIGDIARWGELGPYELLLKMPADDLAAASRLPALVALEREDGQGTLLATLEAFFDHAGDVRRTAESLRVHRATLYHRLKRIEHITGCRLDSGDDRLTLHLGLKLRVLARHLPEADVAGFDD
ncbi:PucR family transcriptional regulator [Streptomyces celluloflavus]|uniref:PucR family transcriptional regulator n=1 Tax=Streptomyces celluloflavus TaxID=58344 RepID=UPI00346164C0|nr:helix-turn-helix domain-containing protein [Streptomyces celluloflavus]